MHNFISDTRSIGNQIFNYSTQLIIQNSTFLVVNQEENPCINLNSPMNILIDNVSIYSYGPG